MGKRPMRKRYEASFKARAALAALKDDKTLSEFLRAGLEEFGGHLKRGWRK